MLLKMSAGMITFMLVKILSFGFLLMGKQLRPAILFLTDKQ